MDAKILWIEDDYYSYQYLVRKLQRRGIEIDYALTAVDGYFKASEWKQYTMMLIDIIMPLRSDVGSIPEVVKGWQNEKHLGIGLLKWLKRELKADCPILILSVVDDPISTYGLGEFGIADYISKHAITPSMLEERILKLIAGEKPL